MTAPERADSPLRLFYSDDFTGHWPVGVAALVVASDEKEAALRLGLMLNARGLKFDGTLTEVPLACPGVVILRDGNY